MDIATKQSLLLQAGASHIETTISQSCILLDIECESLLERIATLSKSIDALGMELIPGTESGDLETPRILRSKSRNKSEEEILCEIQQGESYDLEFKSSLLIDLKRLEHDKNATLQELKSAEVIHSALKTIAAFMNSDGGILYLGVADDESICGLEHDLQLLPEDKQNWDTWELEFSQLVDTKFRDGRGILNFVKLTRHTISEKNIVRVEVTARSKLTLINKKGEFILYRRQGNRTIMIGHDLLEDFYELKKR